MSRDTQLVTITEDKVVIEMDGCELIECFYVELKEDDTCDVFLSENGSEYTFLENTKCIEAEAPGVLASDPMSPRTLHNHTTRR